ncbi:MAG TPA: type II/IV secretion system protein [Candidatus Moranbacteria bacterium]|nr:type II/IV secretion system protein [Candidatus Moranbacteria bacterium]
MVNILKNKKLSKTKQQKKELVEKTLKKLKTMAEEEKASALAKKHSLPYLDLNIFPFDIETLRLIPEKDSLKYQIALIRKVGKNAHIALTDPTNKDALTYIENVLEKEKGWKTSLYVVSLSSMKTAWKKYKENVLMDSLDFFSISLTGEDLKNFEKNFKDLLELKDRMSELSTTEILDTVFSGAVKMKASDIHFETQKKDVRMRYRIDGVLQDIGDFPKSIYKPILSRIKMIGKMKLNLRDIAQDGHFSIEVNDINDKKKKLDIRVSIIPGKYGESIVMRLLDQSSILVDIDKLGLRGLANEQVQTQIAKPNGMILVTGPTGSGKTTTLYSFLHKLNTPDVKIITIEDPIEYDLKGVSQTQVNNDRGYTFGKGLRAIVRQDPDIILVGEIRDNETAEISVNAALTGHLVFSTLHTNNAPASISRMIELGIRPSLISSSLNIVIAQRLVRKLCPHCRKKYKPTAETVNTIKKIISIISPKSKINIPKDVKYLYKPVGCIKCNNLGYQGRIGIFETLTINENMERLILEMAGESEITKAALEDGMITMTQDGILKVLEGITSMEEVWRVTGQADFLKEIYDKLMEQSLSRAIRISAKQVKEVYKNLKNIKKFNDYFQTIKSENILKAIISGAVILKAGDIHIEPEDQDIKIRFRIDGILQTIATLPLNEYPALLGKIKLLSGLETGVRSGVQDSRFKISFEKNIKDISEEDIDVRVSIISGGFGETVVMRLLNKSATALDIDKLGIRQQNLDKLLHEISKPNGIILNTGPTGSGKTTTLYSLLKVLNKPEVKIITVEDPIEYQLKGILQTQVDKKENYTFSSALRALLRQNPDIIMIGEIRDNETAQISVQASLTGHLILSTLHTNDAASSVHRLINMEVDSDELASSVNAFMAQRLVRKLCDCKKKILMPIDKKPTIEKTIKTISKKSGVSIPKADYAYQAVGCEKCNFIGYKGRTVISEILVVDKEIEKLISLNALPSEIKSKAIENGMLTMRQDGILKVLEGETTLEEINRVVGE